MIISDVTYNDQEPQAPERGDELGKEAFLTLLVAQLSHQDPLNPMDGMEFTSQLSQFTELEQMFNLNEKLDSLIRYQSSLNNWQGVAMIGKEVEVSGDWIERNDGEGGMVGYHLDYDCSEVTVQIFNGGGRVVRTLRLGAKGRGDHVIDWNGKDDKGASVPDGRYTVTVSAGKGEEAGSIATFVRGRITGVSFEGEEPVLLMGGERIPFASVLKIQDVSEG